MKTSIRCSSIPILAVGLVFALAAGAPAASLEVGEKAPEFKLADTSGKEHKLSAYKGKVVVLDFCSQKCPWSRGADPSIADIARKYKEKGVVFLGIDSHNDTPSAEIETYRKEVNIPYPILKDKGNEYADAVRERGLPRGLRQSAESREEGRRELPDRRPGRRPCR
jgi:peroxiredoxin